MKHAIVLISTLIVLSLCNCQSKADKNLSSSDDGILTDDKSSSIQSVDTSAFCPRLLKEIKSFISQNGEPVITVQIEEIGCERYVFIATNLYYDTRFLCGYEIIDGRMIAYNYSYAEGINDYYDFMAMSKIKESRDLLKESDCAEYLIDKSKLKTDFPISFFDDPHNGYADEKSPLADGFYEPVGRRLLIHSSDSLELVFEGYY